LCRYSDAAFIAKASGVQRDQGGIARPPVGSISWDGAPTYRIIGEHQPIVGNKVIKIGRVSGRTSGDIDRTCANINNQPHPISKLCQGRADYYAVGGDSGGPVFWTFPDGASLNIKLVGLHWGGTVEEAGPLKVWFSPIANMERSNTELGELITCADLSC
jgi:hypothetical protein